MPLLLYTNVIEVNSPTHDQPQLSKRQLSSRISLPCRLARLGVDFTNELHDGVV